MTETRTCEECGTRLITHRADARFCGKDCNNIWHNRQRRRDAATDKHLTGVSGDVGSRGGNVRSVQGARELQEQVKEKARWTLIVREHLSRTLIETGYFHADDLFDLGVPPEHDAIKGSQTAAFVCRGLMTKAGERKCSHKAANGRKAKIYRITEKGKRELASAGLRTDNHLDSHGGEDQDGGAVTPVSAEPGNSQPGEDAPLPASSPGAVPDQLQEGRDRQVMGAGCDEDRSAIPPNLGASARGTETDNSRRKSQPASRPEDPSESLTLLPEPLNFTDPDQRRAA